jgi:hypothetical protein
MCVSSRVEQFVKHSHLLGKNRDCSANSLDVRKANPALPIIPLPKPPVVPIPVIPKPNTPLVPVPAPPKPLDPVPQPPKPQDPVLQPPKPDVPPQPKPIDPVVPCKRAPGGECSNTAKFDAPLEVFRQKGESALRALVAAQRVEKPQDVNRASVATRYETQMNAGWAPPLSKDERKFVEDLGVKYSIDDSWTLSTIKNKEEHSGSSNLDNIIVNTSENPRDGAIVITDSRNKENDKLLEGVPDDGGFPKGNSLPWSDMVMFNWKQSCLRDQSNIIGPDTLKYMVRNNIDMGDSADETRNLIDAAIERTKGDPAKVNTFRGDPAAPGITSDEIAAYQLLAGSPHGHRVVLMLADYANTMRNVRIESFSVTTTETAAADEAYNVLIKFVKIETP